LAERLPERTSPELTYLETKFAALVSYGLALKLLDEVLPIGQSLSVTALRNQVRQTAERLETERGRAQDIFKDSRQTRTCCPKRPSRRSSVWTAFTSTPRASTPEPKAGSRSSWASVSRRRTKPPRASAS